LRWRGRPAGFLPVVLAVLTGCGSPAQSYINPDVDFGFMQRAAVLPFTNLSGDHLADERLRSIFLMELLKEDVLEVVDPNETAAVVRAQGLSPDGEMTPDQAVALGKKLEVQGLFFGIVEQYGVDRSARDRGPEVTVVFGLVETETGSTVWRSQIHADGASLWKRLFGGGTAGLYEVSLAAVRGALRTLL
jgi:TolB-like protein